MKKKFTTLFKAASVPAAAFLFASLLFSSCAKNELEGLQFSDQPKTTSMADISNDKTNTSTDIHPTPGIPADAMIGISHGACLGPCPNYTVTLSKTGVVIYTGIRNVSVTGTVRYMISPDVAYQLGDMMQRNGFFNLADQYPMIPDAQRFETSLVWKGKIKTVVDYGINIPEELRMMREKVEKALDVSRLVNGDVNNPAANVRN